MQLLILRYLALQIRGGDPGLGLFPSALSGSSSPCPGSRRVLRRFRAGLAGFIKTGKLVSLCQRLGQIRQPRPGAKFSRSDIRKEPIAPTLGQHSEEILHDLGLSGAEIKELVDKGILMTSSGDSA